MTEPNTDNKRFVHRAQVSVDDATSMIQIRIHSVERRPKNSQRGFSPSEMLQSDLDSVLEQYMILAVDDAEQLGSDLMAAVQGRDRAGR